MRLTMRTGRVIRLILGASVVTSCAKATHANLKPYIVEGACPFECCTYGAWVAERTIPVLERADHGARQIAVLHAGDTVVAETGHTAAVPAPFVLRMPAEWEGYTFQAGDTIWVLSYVGEGFFTVRYKGEIIDELGLGFSPYGGTLGTRCETCAEGSLTRDLVAEWWARVRLPDGRIGWTNEAFTFSGKDACSDDRVAIANTTMNPSRLLVRRMC